LPEAIMFALIYSVDIRVATVGNQDFKASNAKPIAAPEAQARMIIPNAEAVLSIVTCVKITW